MLSFVLISGIFTGERAGQLLASYFPCPEVFANVFPTQLPSRFVLRSKTRHGPGENIGTARERSNWFSERR